MQKVTKGQVQAALRNKGWWEGWLIGNKTNLAHMKAGWHLGMRLDESVFKEDYSAEQKLKHLDSIVQSALYYMDPELGNGIHYYEEEE